jgi:predicted transcriptional regulator of viral defense system
MLPRPKKTSWDKLFEVAEGQAGLFTAEQASEAGLYRQLLRRYVEHGRVRRLRRGIYRMVHFPASDQEPLVELWLWTKGVGVFSHETALSLHDLSDVLPRRVHLTVPLAWRARRLTVPKGLVLHPAALGKDERAWVGPVPVTTPERTILDGVRDHVAPDLIAQAIAQAGERGLVAPDRLAELRRALAGGAT